MTPEALARENDMRQALTALRLEVPKSIADDLAQRFDAFVAALTPAAPGEYPKPAKIVSRREREPLSFDDDSPSGSGGGGGELVRALESIAVNTCCDRCQEAALIAKAALARARGQG